MNNERIRQLERQGILNMFEAQELAKLRDEQQSISIREEQIREKKEQDKIGKKMFQLKYEYGHAMMDRYKWEKRFEEIWGENATEAAELSCRRMMSQESSSSTSYWLTDALTCRLNVFDGNQAEQHDPIWVNPYSIAPSQIADGGPFGFLEALSVGLTGNGVDITNGEANFLIFEQD